MEKETEYRYFFFTFCFMAGGLNGNGNLSFKSEGFPSRQFVTNAAVNQVKEESGKYDYEISIVINGWIEMNESDYYEWNWKK